MVSRRSFLGSAVPGTIALVGAPGLLRVVATRGATRRPDAAFTLTAGPGGWDAGGHLVPGAWMFNGQVPGPELRVREGDLVRVTLHNALPEPTTIHWHGVPVPFAMDGVPELTQSAVPPGASFVYEFAASVPGTYWYHSHFAYQIERGLFGALVVEPKHESLVYDREFTLVLDDWLHDVEHPVPSASPYNFTVGGVAMGAVDMSMMGTIDDDAGTPATDIGPQAMSFGSGPGHGAHGVPMREPVFDSYTINGHVAGTSPPLVVRRGERVRIRLVNAATATVFPIYLAGHRFTVTHSDGQPVTPYQADVVAIGMGERIDVIISANNPGAWRLGSSDPRHRTKGMGTVLRYAETRADASIVDRTPPRVDKTPYRGVTGVAEQTPRPVDRSYSLVLSQQDESHWMINDKMYPDTERLVVKHGERIRVSLANRTPYAHPVHLHGHFFDVVRPYGAANNVRRPLRKDTLTLYHMDEHVIEFTADNPGPRWFVHCHNQYHHVGGMATEIHYL